MYTVSKLSSPEKAIVLFLQINTVLLLASGHFSHEFGHHSSREANFTWQKLAAARIDLPNFLPIQQESTAKICQMREVAGQRQAQHGNLQKKPVELRFGGKFGYLESFKSNFYTAFRGTTDCCCKFLEFSTKSKLSLVSGQY